MSRRFNLDEYEPVEERIKRFYADHPNGAITTELKSDPDNTTYAVFRAEIRIADLLVSTGWAQEVRDMELKKTRDGAEYEAVNYTSWLENAETSAIGRALANYNYAGSRRPSREEMQHHERKVAAAPAQDALRTEFLAYLMAKEEVIGSANATILREGLAKHGDAEWIRKALDRTRAEVEKQEAILAANATKKTPLDTALGKLKETVGVEVKQAEIF